LAAFDAQNENSTPGSSLRNEAANYLSAIYGDGRTEVIVAGKTVDGIFTYSDLGSRETVLLEAKDYSAPLHRNDVVKIWVDYQPVLADIGPAKLLVVSRRGLAPGAQAYVDSQPAMRHLTIWELEDQVLGLRPYVDALTELFDEDGLSRFYVHGRAQQISYSADMVESVAAPADLGADVEAWLSSPDPTPIAILGGYGAGKSSFARWLVTARARIALDDPAARRPILIRLGGLARYNSLEGILGSMFTSQHTVRGYNFRRFMDFNGKGRFVIVLDGFDEMKHAMSFSEFRAQIAEFNQLVVPGAKVVLLGRPSAFTTDAEHHYVLKGRVPSQDHWRKLAGWPEFREYRLTDFTAEERNRFIAGFLAHQADLLAAAGKAPAPGWVEERVREVSELAATDPSVFGRPVHLKILAELAADPAQDFTRLRRSLTRWSLYDEFFQALARREAERPARTPIGEEARLEFLRELAFWLWQERASGTSFVAEAIPATLLGALPDGDAHEVDHKRREYLAGAFLERKAGDIYYFPHRSFAEFLVAARMLAHPPGAGDHATYGAVAAEGVLEFLLTAENAPRLQKWAETLGSAQGALRPSYIRLLISAFDGANELNAATAATYWTLPIRLLGGRLRLDGDNIDPVRKLLLGARVPELSLALQLLQPNGAIGVDHPESRGRLATMVAGVLLERVLRKVSESAQSDRLSMEGEEAEQIRELALSGILSLGQGRSGRAVRFSWGSLIAAARKSSVAYGVSIDWDETFDDQLNAAQEIPLDQVLAAMTPAYRSQAQAYVYRLVDIRNIVVVARKRPAGGGAGIRRVDPRRR
jgi:hypothetical protein